MSTHSRVIGRAPSGDVVLDLNSERQHAGWCMNTSHRLQKVSLLPFVHGSLCVRVYKLNPADNNPSCPVTVATHGTGRDHI